jgi:hypothetical protein
MNAIRITLAVMVLAATVRAGLLAVAAAQPLAHAAANIEARIK